MKRQLVLILGYVFIDVLGFSLILPLLPFYAEAFDATPTLVGLLLGANAVTQMIGAPLIGRLSDRYGRRPLLIASIAGTVVSFLILGLANSLIMLFISRILDGLLGGNISLAQSYITDVTEEKDRATGLGLIGAAFGVGFIFGPAIGGSLSAGGNYALPALIASGLSALNLLGVILFLPESLSQQERQERAQSPAAAITPRALWIALHRPCVGPLLHHRLFYGLAFTMFQTLFAVFASRQLGLTARSTSYVLTYVGLVIAAVQGGGLALLTKHFSDKQLVFGGSMLLSVALALWALTTSVWLLLVVLVPLALAGGVLGVVINSALTKSVSPQETGGTLGLSASLDSFARVISPILGGLLIDKLGTPAPGILGGLTMAWLTVFAWRRILGVPDGACPAPAPETLVS